MNATHTSDDDDAPGACAPGWCGLISIGARNVTVNGLNRIILGPLRGVSTESHMPAHILKASAFFPSLHQRQLWTSVSYSLVLSLIFLLTGAECNYSTIHSVLQSSLLPGFHSLVLSRTFNHISDYFWRRHHRTSPDTPEPLLFLPLRFFNKWNRKTMSVGLMLLICWFVINFPNPIITCHLSRTEKSVCLFFFTADVLLTL